MLHGGWAGWFAAASRTMRLVIFHAHPAMRQAVLNLEESRIREVANVGLGRSDVLAFWFGESDEGTPDVVRQAAIDSLQRGETFYAHNLGLPELRAEVAAYTSRLHRPVGADRIAITSGGVNALMLAVQALVDAGDEVVAITPVWPNLTAQPLIMGANLRCVSLRPQFSGYCRAGGSPCGGAQLLQKLFNDGLAPGLAGDAAIDDAPHGQAGGVQYLVRQRVHAAGGHCRLAAC